MVHTLDRASLKAQCRELLQTAQVSPKGLTALYCGLSLVLNLVDYAAGSFASNGGPELLSMFASVFTMLAGWILATGFALYCMGIPASGRSWTTARCSTASLLPARSSP